MKRISIVGLCLVALFAVSAFGASSAFAGEYGVCLKAAKVGKPAKYVGKYEGKGCEHEVGTGGKYEWYAGTSGIGQPGVTSEDFEIESTSKAAVLSSAAGKISCKSSTGEDTITGPKSDVATTNFSECTLSITGGKCVNLGTFLETGKYEPSVITSVSATKLIDHGETGPSGGEPASGEVWNSFSPLEGSPLFPFQAVYICAPGVIFRTSGSTSGVYKSSDLNKMSNKGEISFGAGKGEQDLNTEFSENGGETWSSTGPNVETVTAKTVTKDKSKIEIRS